ncbi:MAG: hypothetical protein ACKV0T_22915, partial [Planctomycetales bacterium]
LATGAAGGQVELWDPLSGQVVWQPGKHAHYVYTVDFGRDSRTMVSGGDDGCDYVWQTRPPGIVAPDDLAAVWDDLAGEPVAAYRALWALSDAPGRATDLIAEKLRGVNSVVDPERLTPGESEEEAERRQRLTRLLAQRDSKVELALTVRRAISLLAQLETPAAQALLEELRSRDPRGDLGRMAAAALRRMATVVASE